MERDHWIEILRSTGVQTGQSRLHYEREQNARAGDRKVQRHAFQLCLVRRRTIAIDLCTPDPRSYGLPAEAAPQRRLVEPIGIEPTTSSLQSSRSPN